MSVRLVFAVACALAAGAAAAQVRLPRHFGNDMVLQQGRAVAVRGWACPGADVDVAFAGQSVRTRAAADGAWSVSLAPLAASDVGRELSVRESGAASSSLVLTNVVVGEVWILAGQSNMQWPLVRTDDGKAAQARARYPSLRYMFNDSGAMSAGPCSDDPPGAHWEVCTPSNAGRMSGVGFYFGERLMLDRRTPVGLVMTACGGTAMESWVTRPWLEKCPPFAQLLRRFDRENAAWVATNGFASAVADFWSRTDRYCRQLDEAKAGKGKAPGWRPFLPFCTTSWPFNRIPTVHYDAKIAPLAGFPVAGVLWYQGETECWAGGRGEGPACTFGERLSSVIGCWREAWGESLWFVVSGLASKDGKKDDGHAIIRKEQLSVAERLPNVAVASILDTGEKDEVHARDKTLVGERLAHAARRAVYGETSLARTPFARRATFADDGALVDVRTDAGLVARGELRGFELRVGGRWVPASAEIRGTSVFVRTPGGRPDGVRYLWTGWAKPLCSLYDGQGQPVTTFSLEAPGEKVKTPENSSLFYKYADPLSGVVSYVLKPGVAGENQQQLYFTSRSMTDDGRFLVIDWCDNEYSAWGVYRDRKDRKNRSKEKAVVDMKTERVYRLAGVGPQIPYLDVESDVLYYARFDANDSAKNLLLKRELLKDPTKEIVVCRMPEELTKGRKKMRYFTHLTLSGDRTLAFLDTQADDDHIQGVLNIRTGAYTKWHEGGAVPHINHGQINPVRNDIALCAWECVPWTDSKGVVHEELRDWDRKNPGQPYPRLQLCEPGRLTMVPAESKYATHERWDEQGEGFYWCAASGVWYHDLKTGRQQVVSPKGGHAFMSCDRNYVVSDIPVGGAWRGKAWQVYFHNRKTNRGIHLFTYRPPICPKETPSAIHPDAHPQFVCRDRYVISTIGFADGHVETAITPVDELIRKTSVDPVKDFLKDLPAAAEPKAVGRTLAEHFLETPPDKYGPRGVTRAYKSDHVPYAVVSLWINALAYAQNVGDRQLLDRLVAEWKPFADGGAKEPMRSAPYHVDFTVFGAVPCEIYLRTGDEAALKLGKRYADAQWTMPPADYQEKLPKFLRGKHFLSEEEQRDYLKRGYSPQTRLWIDDMYMITVLQTQAYRASGVRKYMERAAKEALLYLDKLQLKDGPVKGLFYHAPDVKYVWGRGDGWMAAGMALLLKHLWASSEDEHRILEGYRMMMSALLKYQREDGLWGQLVDGADSWSETSGSAMFCYAFIEGVKNGWLEPEIYGPAARKAWIALCGKLDEYGNLKDVCIGTGKKDDRQYYLDRPRLIGDPHGQAPMLWCVNALLEPPKVNSRL